MRHAHFLISTCDMEQNDRQKHATLPFLKIDMRQGGPHQHPYAYVPPDVPDVVEYCYGRGVFSP